MKIHRILIFCTVVFAVIENTLGYAAVVDMERIIVTQSRLAQYEYKAPSNVQVVDHEQIEESGANTVAEILEEIGLHVSNTSTPKTNKADIRGFGDTAVNNVLVLIDGRKVNPIDISGPDLIQIPLESVERIEVIRGAGSVLYGDNAVGGVINIITKKGSVQPYQRLGAEYGSYDTQQADLEASGKKDKFSYFLYSKYDEEGGYRSNSDLLAKDFQGRLGYQFMEELALEISTGWHEDEYGLPGGLNESELAAIGRRGSANEENFASGKDRFVNLGIDAHPWINAEHDFGNIQLDLSYRNRDTYALIDSFPFGTMTAKYAIDTYGLNGKYIYEEPLWNRNFHLVTGIDLYQVKNDILGGGTGLSASTDDLTISKEEFGIYTVAEHEILDQLYLNGGTRLQKAYFTFDQRNTSTYTTQSPKEHVSSGGLRYEYAKGSNVHARLEQTFRFLATDEWYSNFTGLNPDLRHQSGMEYEIGWKHNWRDQIQFAITPYWMEIEDEIIFNPYSVAFGENKNYDKTRRRGIEFTQETDLLKFWDTSTLQKFQLIQTYTFQEPEFRDGEYNGKDIPMAPRHQATQGIKLGFKDHFLLTLNGNYIGSRYAVNDTRNETPQVKPYWTLDSKLSFNKDPIEIFIAVNNIFNKNYSTTVVKSATSSVKDYFPAVDRNYNLGLNYRFY